MVVCDLCQSHVARRNKVEGSKFLSLVRIPKRNLQTLSLDELELIYDIAKHGLMVCQQCKEACDMNDSNCMQKDRINMKAYAFRMEEDRATMKDIVTELDRRIYIQEALTK